MLGQDVHVELVVAEGVGRAGEGDVVRAGERARDLGEGGQHGREDPRGQVVSAGGGRCAALLRGEEGREVGGECDWRRGWCCAHFGLYE